MIYWIKWQTREEGLLASAVVEKKRAFRMEVGTDYAGVGKIQYILGQQGITVLDSSYTDRVDFSLLVPAAECEGLRKPLRREPTAARKSRSAMRSGSASIIRKSSCSLNFSCNLENTML